MALIFALLALMIIPASAQQMQTQTQTQTQTRAMSDRLIEELSSEMSWRIRAMEAEAKVKDLESQLDALKPKDPPKAQ